MKNYENWIKNCANQEKHFDNCVEIKYNSQN